MWVLKRYRTHNSIFEFFFLQSKTQNMVQRALPKKSVRCEQTGFTIAQCPINSGLVNRVTFQWEFFRRHAFEDAHLVSRIIIYYPKPVD